MSRKVWGGVEWSGKDMAGEGGGDTQGVTFMRAAVNVFRRVVRVIVLDEMHST
jgi:hypothetical protein